MNMKERIARAMFEKSRLRLIVGGLAAPGDMPTWERAPAMHAHWFAMAGDALSAMREPTAAMIEASMHEALPSHIKRSFTAMIDAATKEQP